MTGREYLQNIKKELEAGRNQHKKGINILAAFGYSRRRKTALAAINDELKSLGLEAEPPIDEEMPLEPWHISFYLADQTTTPLVQKEGTPGNEAEDEKEESAIELPIPTFKVAELTAAEKPVECIKTNEPLSKAYTIMCKNKYSQLVVTDTPRPLATAIKGTVTYQSLVDALMHGTAKTVVECLDITTPHVLVDDDIGKVVAHLEEHDAVLVIGRDKHLSGIVTAWDLADEFAGLVGPFKWIGEIESRVRGWVIDRLGVGFVSDFLGGIKGLPLEDVSEGLTIGGLVLVVQNPQAWDKLGVPYHREVFSAMLDEVRKLRNRLMHFGEPLNDDEKKRLHNYCDMVRRVSSPSPVQ